MPARLFLCACLLVACPQAFAADPKPVVGPGATKEAVIDAYGWPKGQSTSGSKEVLNYPQGTVTLEEGRVERVDFNPNIPWPAPRPRPGAPSASTAKKPDTPPDLWLTNFDEAAHEATRRNTRILALFTGADWSPASRQFLDDIAFHPDFVNAFTGDFVFLRLDYVTRTSLAPEQQEQNNRLRERYGVTVYPTLLALSPAGVLVGRVDLSRLPAGETYRARVIAAVTTLRATMSAQPLPPDSLPVVAVPRESAAPAVSGSAASTPIIAVGSPLTSAGMLVFGALAAGLAVAGVLFWLLWRRQGGTGHDGRSARDAASRISDAASGLPTPAILKLWSRDKLCAVMAGVAQTDGYESDIAPAAGDKDIVLTRRGDARPSVLVCCAPGQAGAVSAKRLREFFATLTAEGVAVGWFVAPGGFTADARAYAEQQRIVLWDSERLLAQLRDLPPLILPKVLLRG